MSMPQGPTCDCWAATIRIINQTQAPFRNSPSSAQQPARTMPLGDMLVLGRNLVQHWEVMSGCASSQAHLRPPTPRFIAEAINNILRLYEIAIGHVLGESESRKPGSLEHSYRGTGNLYNPRISEAPTSTPASSSTGIPSENYGPLNCNATSTFLGSLELDDDEAAIVGQEALRYSIIRLAIMLQGIEAEARQRGPVELPDAGQALEDKEVKELFARVFRLLGKINGSNAI